MPDAPSPTYDSHGNRVAAWKVTIEYDDARDELRLCYRADPGPYSSGHRRDDVYDPADIEDALGDLTRAIRIMGARRLF